jgi:tetratricopeptide (TPR) repeat protein
MLPGADSSDTAVSWYNAALNVDPEYAAAHAGKCSAFVGNYFENSDGELIGSAESSCFRALELNPNLDVVHTALGNLYQATGQHEDALSAYRQALRINPGSVGSLTGMGAVYGQINEPDKAEQSLRQAIGLLPGDWSPYNALGSFLFNSGRYDEAAEQYEHVVALDRDNMIGYSNLGTAYMLAGSFEKAAPALQQAIDIEPRSQTYGSLGLMHYYLGDLDAAIRAHQNAINLAPNEPLTWSNLGDALWIAEREREARSAFESAESLALAALEVNPTDPYTQMDLAWISAMLGSTSDALDLIEAARSQLPDDPYANYIDGLVHLKAGETAAALIALHIAVEKGYSLEMMAAEPHLVELRSNAEFAELIRPGETP